MLLDKTPFRVEHRTGVVTPETPLTSIAARSKRQVMDWSLVLASQDIPSTIVQEDSGWALLVENHDLDRSLQAIRQFQAENRAWRWEQPVPWSDATFHWGALTWCSLLAAVHWVAWAMLPGLRIAGRFDTAAAASGEWWRAFTAVLLHADLGHLLANMTFGFILLGLAMARYGAGTALLATYLSGAAGNLAGFLLRPEPYFGVGASGMVMGALGLIAIQPFREGVFHPRSLRQLMRAALAGVLLFVLLGMDPTSDVIAHLGGFVSGALFGIALNLAPEGLWRSRSSVRVTWLLLSALFLCTSWIGYSEARKVPPDRDARIEFRR
jgi:rhomboid protease GluP